jgi:predicted anti-sigma-YlaC factor YlaD
MEKLMEHEEYTMLMMDAMDGLITGSDRERLDGHLHECADCRQQWQAMMAIDLLFRQSPVLKPAADFAQRTIARLPSRRARLWTVSMIYFVLLISGIIPILFGIWAYNNLLPLLREPALINGILTALDKGFQVSTAVLNALFDGLGELVLQQPAILGGLLVTAGTAVLWSGVYRQLTAQPVRANS